MLLAAFGDRRHTRVVDLQAEALDNDTETVRDAICVVVSRRLDDGVIFEVRRALAPP